jgi:hypothetical protein
VRLELVRPPRLVSVADAGAVGGRRPALLMATRGGRHYVQVSSGPGLNTLRWVSDAALGPPADASADLMVPPEPALPWIRSRAGR